MRQPAHLGAASLVLSAEDLRGLTEAADAITIVGDRYPEHIEKMTGL